MAAPAAGLPAAAPIAAPAAAPKTVPTAALPATVSVAAWPGATPPICCDAYWRHATSSAWKASKVLSLPGITATAGPVGGATAQPPSAKTETTIADIARRELRMRISCGWLSPVYYDGL